MIIILINFQNTVLHELCHILGMEHEHQRPDRDDYVEINWTNIKVKNQKKSFGGGVAGQK